MLNLTRKEGWEERLNNVVQKYISIRKLQYGKYDCAYFFADCVLAITGEDLIEPYRGYKTKLEGINSIICDGFNNVNKLVDSKLARTSVLCVTRGDLVSHTNIGDTCLTDILSMSPAVVLGTTAMSINESGIINVNICDMNLAWSVG